MHVDAVAGGIGGPSSRHRADVRRDAPVLGPRHGGEVCQPLDAGARGGVGALRVSLVFAVIVLRPWANSAHYVMQRPYVQVLRGLFLLGSTVFNFLALRYLQLAETAAIAFAAPFFIVGLAGPVLGEWAGPRRWAAASSASSASSSWSSPGPDTFQPAALLSLARRLLLRRLQPHHPPPQPHRVAAPAC